MKKEIRIPMDWIRIPFPISLATNPDLNPPMKGFKSDFQKNSEYLPEKVDSNPPHNKFESKFQ